MPGPVSRLGKRGYINWARVFSIDQIRSMDDLPIGRLSGAVITNPTLLATNKSVLCRI